MTSLTNHQNLVDNPHTINPCSVYIIYAWEAQDP